MPVLGAGCARGGDRAPGAGAGCRRWLCAWWRGLCSPDSDSYGLYGVLIISSGNGLAVRACCGAGAGCCELAVRVVETRCRCWVLAVCVVETAGAGAGGVSCSCRGEDCCARGGDRAGCWCWRAGARRWRALLTVK